ncbi:MAG TPA: hypothetical protein ENI99_01420 [Sedimenticola sp.]|nr:hypothetical protein [Sedimenticola sp.]
MLSSAWLAVLSLILAPVYVHLLGIESYGLIGLYTAALAIGGILDVALSATVSREIAWILARPAERPKIGALLFSVEVIYGFAVFLIALSLLAGVEFFGAAWVHASTLPHEQIKGALALMLLSLMIQLPSGLYTASLIGLHKQARSASILAGFGTMRGVGAALIAWGVSDDIRAFFLWHIVVGVLQIIWLRWQTWSYVRTAGGRARFAIEPLMSIRHAAGAMFLITAMGMVLSQMDKIVLSFLVSLESLGHYTLAWGLAAGLSILATPVAQGFGARFSTLASGGNYLELEKKIDIASQFMYVLMIPPAVMISFFAETIMLVWVRDSSIASASAAPLSLLALGTALVGCVYPLLNALYAKKQFKPVLIIQFVFLLFFFPLLLLLAGAKGIQGAALCWLIYGALLFVTYLVLTAIRHGNPGFFAKLLKNLISVTLISVAIGWPIKHFSGQLSSHVAMLGLAGFALVGGWLLSASICPDLQRGLGETVKAVRISMRNPQ